MRPRQNIQQKTHREYPAEFLSSRMPPRQPWLSLDRINPSTATQPNLDPSPQPPVVLLQQSPLTRCGLPNRPWHPWTPGVSRCDNLCQCYTASVAVVHKRHILTWHRWQWQLSLSSRGGLCQVQTFWKKNSPWLKLRWNWDCVLIRIQCLFRSRAWSTYNVAENTEVIYTLYRKQL